MGYLTPEDILKSMPQLKRFGLYSERILNKKMSTFISK